MCTSTTVCCMFVCTAVHIQTTAPLHAVCTAVLMQMLVRPPHKGLPRSSTHCCSARARFCLLTQPLSYSKPILILLTGVCALSAVRPGILHPRPLYPRTLFKSPSNHGRHTIKAAQSRPHTIQAAAGAMRSRPHIQASRPLKAACSNRSLSKAAHSQGRSRNHQGRLPKQKVVRPRHS